jgi:hypothetical protein
LVRLQERTPEVSWSEIRKRLEGRSWHQRYHELAHLWAPEITSAVAARTVDAVVRAPETPEWIDVTTPESLDAMGYRRVFRGRSFEVFGP